MKSGIFKAQKRGSLLESYLWSQLHKSLVDNDSFQRKNGKIAKNRLKKANCQKNCQKNFTGATCPSRFRPIL